MSEPDWQPTARLRYREVANRYEQPVAYKLERGEHTYYVLEQLWEKVRQNPAAGAFGGIFPATTKLEEEWRPVPVEDAG